MRIAGFLPILSDARPQGTAVKHCESEKVAAVMPAHLATSFFSTPKFSIISGYKRAILENDAFRLKTKNSRDTER
jgi:hypothetical protein